MSKKRRAADDWARLWAERDAAVTRVLGEVDPPGIIASFRRLNRIPGACALKFAPSAKRDHFLYMTLGMTQPGGGFDPSRREFAVRTKDRANWPLQMLHDLVTRWLRSDGEVGEGSSFPFAAFADRELVLFGAIRGKGPPAGCVGDLRRVYLLEDDERLSFRVSSGNFGLLTAVAVSGDEEKLAEETSPAHLMLLFRKLRVSQVMDLGRATCVGHPGFEAAWKSIARMSEAEVRKALRRQGKD